MALTPKQQHFARCVVGGMSLSDSYREAYNAERMKSASIRHEASLLMADPTVTATVERLQSAADRATMASRLTDKDIVLKSLRHHVEDSDSDSNKIRATEVLGRTVPGLFKGEEPAEVPRSTADIQSELAERLAAIQADQVKHGEDQDAEKEQPGPTLKAV